MLEFEKPAGFSEYASLEVAPHHLGLPERQCSETLIDHEPVTLITKP
jgi:hypothetical protein